MEAQEFANWVGAIESIVVITAIVAGGLWTVFNYRVLSERLRAQREIVKMNEEIEKIELEKAMLRREFGIGPVINITISPTQKTLPDKSMYFVEAIVEIENKGEISANLNYKDINPFSVYSVSFKEYQPNFEKHAEFRVPYTSSPNVLSHSVNIRAGGTEIIPFFFEVVSPGLYLLAFAVPLAKEEQERAETLGFKFPGDWSAKKYFVVESTPPNKA